MKYITYSFILSAVTFAGIILESNANDEGEKILSCYRDVKCANERFQSMFSGSSSGVSTSSDLSDESNSSDSSDDSNSSESSDESKSSNSSDESKSSEATVENIGGYLHGLNFTIAPGHLAGFSKCKVISTGVNDKELKVRHELLCPQLLVYGRYDIIGVFLNEMPIMGNGEFSFDCRNYRIHFEVYLEYVTGSSGKEVFQVKRYDYSMKAEKIVFSWENLFDGHKDMSDAAHRFANHRWAEIADQFQKAIFGPFFNQYVKVSNNYFMNE